MITDLFSYNSYPNEPGFKEGDTSKAAAQSMKAKAPRLRGKVLALFDRIPVPITADEAADLLGETVLAIRPRFTELQFDGLIVDTGLRRKNKSGRSAKVWRKA